MKSLLYALFALTVGASSHAAARQLEIDFGNRTGQIRHNALGFLHAFGRPTAPGNISPERLDELYLAPLQPRWYRFSGAAVDIYAPRIRKHTPDARMVISLSDGYFTSETVAEPWADHYKRWTQCCLSNIAACQKQKLTPIYDMMNEPEGVLKKSARKSPAEIDDYWRNFYALYLVTYKLVRAHHPGAAITAPGYGYTSMTVAEFYRRLGEFLDFCREHDAMPDYINYHFPLDQLENHIAFLRKKGVAQPRVLMNEYLGPSTYKLPAANLETFAYYETVPELEGAMRATWIRWGEKFGTLGGTFFMDTPRHQPDSRYYRMGNWFAYRAYAQMQGDIYRTSVEQPLRALAARCGAGYRIIIGSQTYGSIEDENRIQPGPSVDFTGPVEVRLKGLPAGRYRIIVQEIVQTGSQETKKFMYPSAEAQPEPAVNRMLVVDGSGASVSFDWRDAKSGWYVDVLPESP